MRISKSEYLYGVQEYQLVSIEEGLKDRINKADQLLLRLVNEPLETRDFERIEAVSKAIDWCEQLLKERSEYL